jgi:predicted dehydrogenase
MRKPDNSAIQEGALMPTPRALPSLAGLLLTVLLVGGASTAGEPVAAAEEGGPVRVVVAGLTHTHVHWILGRPDRGDIEIVGIAESNRDLARRYTEQHGLAMDLVHDDLEDLLDRARPDAVTAFGTIREHLAVVEAAAPRGIHVMVEKPLAVSLDHARRMATLAREHGIHLLTNYETTWYGSNRRLYQMVHGEGALGAIRKMVVHDGHPGPVAIGVNEEFLEWLIDPVHNGAGALTDFGCYGADLMTWLMKGQRPLSVTAVTQQLQPDLYPKVDDEATIVLAYPEAQGIIQASWNWPFSRKDTHVYGERGYVHALDAARLRLRLGQSEETEAEVPAPPPPYDDPFAYLAATVRGEIAPAPDDLSSLELNLVVMEILDAAMESARTGRRVDLGPGSP